MCLYFFNEIDILMMISTRRIKTRKNLFQFFCERMDLNNLYQVIDGGGGHTPFFNLSPNLQKINRNPLLVKAE